MTSHLPCGAASRDPRRCRRDGFTLVELLVAATLALVVMAALASLFGIFGRAVADSQDLVHLAARMRAAAWRLRQDLQGVTTDVRPFIRPESACGYFEIVEGPLVDSGSAGSNPADYDDVLLLTTSSPGRPFAGVISGTVGFESPVAEVAWFCKQAPQTADGLQLYNLYRRQLLVAATPGAGALTTTNTTTFSTWDAFYLANDISVRREGTAFVANSLADLTRRQSRFMHFAGNASGNANPGVWLTGPRITSAAVPAVLTGTTEVLTGAREGEDLLLSNVLSFDVRVFDPQQSGGGAYVNLGSGGAAGTTALTRSMTSVINFTGLAAGTQTYDTWSAHVEFNGIQDNSTWPQWADRSTNWIDNNSNGVVDDASTGEYDQGPPYAVPLRGVEIRIRCYEPSSQEVRQITVQHSFLAR